MSTKSALSEKSDSHYESLLKKIPLGLGIYRVSSDYSVELVFLNDGYYKMIGAKRKDRTQYLGKRVFLPIYKEDIPELKQTIKEAILHNKHINCKFRLLFGDGLYHWIELQATREKQKDGTYLFYTSYYSIDSHIQTQNQLREDEEKLEEAVADSETQYFTYYPKTRSYEITVVNKNFINLPCKMDNFPESFIEYAHLAPEEARKCRAMIHAIDTGAKKAECDCRFADKNITHWYRIKMTNMFDDKKKPVKAFGYANDITALKDAERRLSEEMLQLRALSGSILSAACFNVTKDIIIELNGERKIYDIKVPAAVEKEAFAIEPQIKLQNRQTKNILIKAASQIPDKQERKDFILATCHVGLLKLFKDGKDKNVIEYRRKIGADTVWVSTRIELLPTPGNGDILAFIYTENINSRHLAEEITHCVIGKEYDHFFAVDLKTKKIFLPPALTNGRTVPMNGLDYEKSIVCSIERFVAPNKQKECKKEFALQTIIKNLEKEKKYTFSYQVVATSETEARTERVDVFYLNKDKNILLFVRSDITKLFEKEQKEKKQLEELAAKAESASIAKSDFLSRMSHDIRTPLNGIIGMTTLALDENKNTKIADYLSKINESGRFLLGLVNDILDMSKVESGKLELHPVPYQNSEFLQYLHAVIEPLCAEKQVTLILPETNRLYGLVVDKLRFNQIFFNLLSNAVKFTPSGGTVELKKTNVSFSGGTVTTDYVVSDNGIGMTKEFQKKLFTPFEQEYTGKNTSRSGSGLGLAITKSLVDMMGGTISVQSDRGKGSAFTVHLSLPAAPVHNQKEKTPAESARSFSGKHILLAEDNDINAEIAQTLLEKKGIRVTRATNGKEALSLFKNSKENEFFCVLMDIRMPFMDGLEATRRIRALNRADAAKIRIVAMTANAFDEDIKESFAAGMNGHLSKPIDPAQMYEALM